MGPAHVGFPKPLRTYVKSYLHCLKNCPSYDTKAMRKSSIFVRFDASTQTAMALSSSAINKGINKLWAEVHGTPVSTTKIRKSVVTHVRKAIPGSRDMLDAHMSWDSRPVRLLVFINLYYLTRFFPENEKQMYLFYYFHLLQFSAGTRHGPAHVADHLRNNDEAASG